MKIKGGLFATAAVLVLLGMVGVTSRADVIYEPEDRFFVKHRDECEYEPRQYEADSPDGTVIIYESPKSKKETGRISNGEYFYISYVYTDKNGNSWGYHEDWSRDIDGWIPMAYAKILYDSICFGQQYDAVIRTESGSLEEQYVGEEVYGYDFPGSSDCFSAHFPEAPGYVSVFTDPDGRNWGFVTYFQGYRDFWICLDAPCASYDELFSEGHILISFEIPGKENEEESKSETKTETEAESTAPQRIVPESDTSSVVLIGGLIAALVVITGTALGIWKKRMK